MQASLGPASLAAQPAPCLLRARTHYVPPCAPSSSGRAGLVSGAGRRVRVQAGKKDDDSKREREREFEKADFSAKWALRVKNFFSSRRKYLDAADKGGSEDAGEKAFKAEIAAEEAKLLEMRESIIATRVAELEKDIAEGPPREGLVAGDIARARLDLQTSPLARVSLAVVRVQSLLRALVLLPFTLVAAAMRGWQELFKSKSYENFLMSEGERIWYWRNRTENERWFWEVFVWDRLLFPILVIVCYEFIVPNHFLWSVVAPVALLCWLSGRLATPDTPEFWLLAYFGFYRKAWPELAAWLGTNVAAPLMGALA
ncbi:hypothetical protein HYH03_003730 [Edaphochlamys debaryana]|uniref:Uncharacterized protein n=1 Tax=Edaphochlamys debaryana TaxID=47281 RepID=A0A836C470_9CHLO|nr:hypothetical protein HYH03_003730 [Edaphochlamys debaryana]|eukprot:KAG2498477.1 hypothetical protein HYH03_003730 [Edaphochlamys debaryana]